VASAETRGARRARATTAAPARTTHVWAVRRVVVGRRRVRRRGWVRRGGRRWRLLLHRFDGRPAIRPRLAGRECGRATEDSRERERRTEGEHSTLRQTVHLLPHWEWIGRELRVTRNVPIGTERLGCNSNPSLPRKVRCEAGG
jgi:hypothetical protein